MPADDRVIDADQAGERANSQDDRQRRKSRGNKCETNYVRFACTPIAIKQCGGTFPIQITRPMYPRTRVQNNILYKLRHYLPGVTVHCTLVHWQVVSRPRLA